MTTIDARYLWQSNVVVCRERHTCDECDAPIEPGDRALREVGLDVRDDVSVNDRPGFSCVYVCDHPWCLAMRHPETFVPATRRPPEVTARAHHTHQHAQARCADARNGWGERTARST